MSSFARYIVDAVVLEDRSPTDLARDNNISRSWVLPKPVGAAIRVSRHTASRVARSCCCSTLQVLNRSRARISSPS